MTSYQESFGELATITTQKFTPSRYSAAFKRLTTVSPKNILIRNPTLPVEDSTVNNSVKYQQQESLQNPKTQEESQFLVPPAKPDEKEQQKSLQNLKTQEGSQFLVPSAKPDYDRPKELTAPVQGTSHRSGTSSQIIAQNTSVNWRYMSMRCSEETTWDGGSNSDEPYVITSAVYDENGKVKTQTQKHPVNKGWYDDVDKKESRYGPIAPIYSGPIRDVTLITILMERDQGNPNAYRKYVDIVVKAAAAGAMTQGVSIPASVQGVVGDALNWLFGTGDDVISRVNGTLYANDLEYYADEPHKQWKGHWYNGFSEHKGGGARYYVFWDVVR